MNNKIKQFIGINLRKILGIYAVLLIPAFYIMVFSLISLVSPLEDGAEKIDFLLLIILYDSVILPMLLLLSLIVGSHILKHHKDSNISNWSEIVILLPIISILTFVFLFNLI